MSIRQKHRPRTQPTKQELFAEVHRLRAVVEARGQEARAVGADRVLLKHMSVWEFLKWRRKR